MQHLVLVVGLIGPVAAGVVAFRAGGLYGVGAPVPGEVVLANPETQQIEQQVSDSDENGRQDTWLYWDDARLQRREVDEDENGLIDWWEYYDENETLVQVGFSTNDDGVRDALSYLGPEGVIERIEYFRADGTVRRTEFYEGNLIVRAEDDHDGDGEVDARSLYRPNGDVESIELD